MVDGRVFTTAASGGAVLLAPDARSSVLLEKAPSIGGQVTATLLDDGRVVIIGSRFDDPARVDVFDPQTDSFERADAMRQARQDHAAVRLHDGTVLVVGGIMSGAECFQALATAEIWDPKVMASIAGDTDVECVPWESPPLPPLGVETSGGRIEMPGSAFAITVPEHWSVELADSDTDVFSAEPGTAWEALRATSKAGTNACSVAIGVADVSLRKKSGTGSGGPLTPMWDPKKPGILLVPSPVVDESEASFAMLMPRERLHRKHEGLEHDAMYSIHCVGDAQGVAERIGVSLEFLPRE